MWGGYVCHSVAKVVFAGWGQERCRRPWKCGPGRLGREVWMSPEMLPRDEMAGCRRGIFRRSRHSQSWRRLWVVPVWGGLNSSNLYSTGNPWSKRLDSRGPLIRWLSSWWCDAAAKRRAYSNYVCPVWKLLRKRVFGGLFPIWCCPEKWSGLNRINHPD